MFDEVRRKFTWSAASPAGQTPEFAAGPLAACASGLAEGARPVQFVAAPAVRDGGAEFVPLPFPGHVPGLLGRVGRVLNPVKSELTRFPDERACRVVALGILEVAAPKQGIASRGHDGRRTGR